MKLLSVVFVAAMAVLAGCRKESEKPAKPEPAKLEAVKPPAIGQALEAAKTQAEAMSKTAEKKLQETQAEVDAIIAQVKKQMEAADYKTALSGIQKALSMPEITPDQKKLLDELRNTASKKMAAAAAEETKTGISNLLQNK